MGTGILMLDCYKQRQHCSVTLNPEISPFKNRYESAIVWEDTKRHITFISTPSTGGQHLHDFVVIPGIQYLLHPQTSNPKN